MGDWPGSFHVLVVVVAGGVHRIHLTDHMYIYVSRVFVSRVFCFVVCL